MADREQRWTKLLEGVRGELGQGRIRGTRLEFSSVAGNWELTGESSGLCLTFTGRKRFPASLQIGPGSTGKGLKTGDTRFDSACSILSSEPATWKELLSPGIRGSLLRLWTLHPSTSLAVTREAILMTLPGTPHGRDAILSFLFHGGACVGEFLHAMEPRA